MKILGIDPGIANCGYGVLEIDDDVDGKYAVLVSGIVSTTARDPMGKRLVAIEDVFYDLRSRYSFDMVAIEEVFYGKFAKAAAAVAKVIGMVEIFSVDNCMPLIYVNPHEVKSIILPDEKKPSKEMMVAAVNKKFGTATEDHHTADALAIALVGAQKGYETLFQIS